jgi:DNA-binding transcriptional MerR regulator
MQLLTQKEAARFLSVSIKTVTRYRKNGLLPTIRLTNTAVRIPQVAVEKLIEVSRCQNHQSLQNTKTESGMSRSEKMDAAKEHRLGRQIRKSQRCGFRAG